MRRHLLLLASICLFSSQAALAQKKPEIKLGLKFAPNLSFIIPTTPNYNYNGVKFGGVLGFVSDIYFAPHYAFSTGFNFAFLGGKISYPDRTSEVATLEGTTHANMSFIYMEIPLMIKMFTKCFGKFSFFGQVGFGTSFRLNASSSYTFESTVGTTNTEKTDITNQTTVIKESVLIGIGTEVHLDQSTRLVMGLGYSHSLNNILHGSDAYDSNRKAYLNYAELNLGVMF